MLTASTAELGPFNRMSPQKRHPPAPVIKYLITKTDKKSRFNRDFLFL